MKTLYIIGGAMGVGKTSACQELKKRLPNAVFLDGDWCWDMDPFVVNEETRAMVMDNLTFCLNRFLGCSHLENIICCWVLHEQSILEELLSRLKLGECRVVCISLICTEEALRSRLCRDIEAGRRTPDVLQRSTARLPLYAQLDTILLDTTELDAAETAAVIAKQ